MKNILKSLLALSLVFSLGFSAAEESTTGMPAQKTSKTKQAAILTASAVANILAVGGIVLLNSYINDVARQISWHHHIHGSLRMSDALVIRQIVSLASTIGLVELSSYLMHKMGLKTNKLCLGLIATAPLVEVYTHAAISHNA